jgi:hypothetical protein
MIVSFWESEEAADASAGLAASLVEEFVTIYRSPAGREHYEVVYVEPPKVAVEA